MVAVLQLENRNSEMYKKYWGFYWIKCGILCIVIVYIFPLQVAFLSRYDRCSAKAFEALSVVSVTNENKAALSLVDVNKKIVECHHLATFLWLHQNFFANLKSMQL